MPAQQSSWRASGIALTVPVAAALVAVAPGRAADFYAGKTIEFLIGGDVGGGYDIYARAIARHLPRFIPGNPTVVPKNQPGAGSKSAIADLLT
jgi:tripartite-type tricarboxylate transporter receptor subunit TctC